MGNEMKKVVDECVEMIKDCIDHQEDLHLSMFLGKSDYSGFSFIPEYIDYSKEKMVVEGHGSIVSIDLEDASDAYYDEDEDKYTLIRMGKVYDFARLE